MANGVIGKVTAGGGTHLVTSTFYGTCATAAGTAAKIVKLADSTADAATLLTGMTLAVKFTNSNTVANPTLTVQRNSNTTNLIAAKSIMRYGTTAPGTTAATSWRAGAVVIFVYDGTNWVMVSTIDDNNTYTVPTAGTTATAVSTTASGGSATTWSKSDHVHSIALATGDNNGQIKIAGTNVSVKGLGTAAYTASTAYATSGHNHDSTYVNVSGDTMTGALTLSGAPTANLHAATKQYVDQSFAANDAMIFKGTIGSSGATVTALPNTHSIGWTYRVLTAGTYAGVKCEIGDLIICIADGTAENNAHWTVAQTNIDGAVIGPASATDGNIALFDGTTGKLIKNSNYSPSSFILSNTNGNTQNLYRPLQLNGLSDNTLDAKINDLRANRLAFLPADQIIIEKTTDGGSTWVDAGVTDAVKTSLFSETRPTVWIPTIDGKKNIKCGLRITFTAMKYNVPAGTTETQKYNYWNSNYIVSTERYNQLKEMYFWVNANSDTISVKAERATGAASTNWTTIFENNSWGMTGWSGNDYIRFPQSVFGGGTNQTTNYWNYRLTFFTRGPGGSTTLSTSSTTSGQGICEIRGYGDTWWTAGNTYAASDHIYSHDYNKNVTFPAQVTATTLAGNLDWSYIQNKPTILTIGTGASNAAAGNHTHPIKTITGTIPTSTSSPWTINATNKTVQISDSKITAKSVLQWGLASTATQAQYEAFAEAQFIDSTTAAGSATIKALGTMPTVAIPVVIHILGETE